MNSHYLIAVVMSALASSTTLILILSFLKKNSTLDETLSHYYGTKTIETPKDIIEFFAI